MILAGDGNDSVLADSEFGGDGPDVVDAGAGDDTVWGGGGNDNVSAGREPTRSTTRTAPIA